MSVAALPSNIVTYKRVVGADPAANNEFLLTVPAGKWWIPISVFALLVQGITQTPQPILVIDDGTNIFFEGFGSTAVQAVSTTCAYTWAPGLFVTGQIGAGAAVVSNAALADNLVLSAGYRIRSSTPGLGANSDYGVPSALVAELG